MMVLLTMLFNRFIGNDIVEDKTPAGWCCIYEVHFERREVFDVVEVMSEMDRHSWPSVQELIFFSSGIT